MKGESVLVDNVMLYYKCVDLVCMCTNHVYFFVIQQTHTVSQSCLRISSVAIVTDIVLSHCMVMSHSVSYAMVEYGYV
jgi:hypothetical protein